MKAHRQLMALAACGSIVIASLATGADQSLSQQASGIADYASPEDPPAFDDPAKAVTAFKERLAADDLAGLAKLFGLDPDKTGKAEGVMDSYKQIREGAAKKVGVEDLGDRKILNIGDRLWPLPFPIVKGKDGLWSFDTYAGLQEIIDRRIGENELEAIATARFYVDAQQDYAAADRDGDGVLEFAQKLVSSEGETDGLYWPLEQGDGESPAGSFVDQGALEKSKAGQGYFGYRFRILPGQGGNVAGGAHSYVINGNMIPGFGLIAWPVKYGESGAKTFMINNYGVLYEADLGPQTESLAKKITVFNPDRKWEVTND